MRDSRFRLRLNRGDIASAFDILILMKYKAIGFDYGGVINGTPGSLFNDKFIEFVGVSDDAYKKAYFAHNRKFNADQPISERELWTLVLTDLNKLEYLEEVMKFVEEMRAGRSINENVVDLVKQLRRKSYKTGLLSNNSMDGANAMRATGISRYFDTFIVSAEVGLMKPDVKIYELFADQLDIKLQELVFIDDSKRSLSASVECGFTPILFESYEKLVEDLHKLEVL